MSLFDGMKDKLGFGNKPEWQVDDYDDYDEQFDADALGGDDASQGSGSVIAFDAYNPANFENVTLSSDADVRVASYDTLTDASSYRSSSSRTSHRTHEAYRAEAGSGSLGAEWDQPEAPAFLDERASAAGSRDDEVRPAARSAGSDPYASLGSDFMRMRGDPATRLAIVKPTQYADVELIANAAKAGKSIVLDVTDTRPALAKRILDFTFGAASALNLNVDKAAERIFVISKGAEMLTADEREYLEKNGIL